MFVTVLNLFLLQLIVVFIVDCSGIVDTIKSILSRFLTKGKIDSTNFSLPLFGCSLCMSFHTGWIYLLITNNFTIPLFAMVCILSFFTPITKELLFIIKEFIIKLINKL